MDEETSNKATEYDEEQIKKEAEQLDQLKPGKDLEALEKAYADFLKKVAEAEKYSGGA